MLDVAQSDRLLLDLALDGMGSDKSALIEFLCARPASRVRAAKQVLGWIRARVRVGARVRVRV